MYYVFITGDDNARVFWGNSIVAWKDGSMLSPIKCER